MQDRVGAARQRIAGYSGTHDLLDRIANARLSARQPLIRLATPLGRNIKPEKTMSTCTPEKTSTDSEKTLTHPCYTKKAHHSHGRVRLPVARSAMCNAVFVCANSIVLTKADRA